MIIYGAIDNLNRARCSLISLALILSVVGVLCTKPPLPSVPPATHPLQGCSVRLVHKRITSPHSYWRYNYIPRVVYLLGETSLPP